MYPFKETSAGTAGELGELALIRKIQEWLGDASPPSPVGIGDDCAVFCVAPQQQGLVTTDPILWKRHFDETVSPELAAMKLVKRNLSDIAAMGGKPLTAVVSLLLPKNTSLDWLRSFYKGMREASHRYQVPISGGDVSETEGLLGACLTLIGETTGGRILRRDTARIQDHVFVTGSLGGSLLGHHFNFEPRLAAGEWLCAREEVTAAIDLSDGLAKDLQALLPRNAQARLFPTNIPVSDAARKSAADSGRPPLAHAFADGEDYELLFTIRGETDPETFLSDWRKNFPELPLSLIGRFESADSADGKLLIGLPEEVANQLSGYEHFR